MKLEAMNTMQFAFKRSGFKIRKPRAKGWPRGYAGAKRIDVTTGEIVQVPADFVKVVREYQGLEAPDLDLDSNTPSWSKEAQEALSR